MKSNRKQQQKGKIKREDFADGSALLTYKDGSQLILETDLAKNQVINENRKVDYNSPPPPPKS